MISNNRTDTAQHACALDDKDRTRTENPARTMLSIIVAGSVLAASMAACRTFLPARCKSGRVRSIQKWLWNKNK
jgi:hypothetical protein